MNGLFYIIYLMTLNYRCGNVIIDGNVFVEVWWLHNVLDYQNINPALEKNKYYLFTNPFITKKTG